MPLKTLLLAVAVSFALAGCTRAADDSAFKEKVRAYLLAHPEMLSEVAQELEDREEAKALAHSQETLRKDPSVRQSLEHDPRDFVANPGGKITVTEFYDYRCPHCINAAPAVLKIIQDNPDVRFVFKEMPIFGATSEHAARTAIAMKNAGGDYLGLYRELMTARGLNDEMVDQIAKAHGVDPAKVEEGQARTAEDAQIADTRVLFDKLSLDGTPTFVIGDTIVPGEYMDGVRAAIAKARGVAKAG
jgi:protein-disulfide isomerase